jgi:MoaA/NifB/PqqE/SkfB family radical SAM enzyme
MSVNIETKQMLEAIKLLKDSNVTESQIYITLKAKYSSKNLQAIQECIRSLKVKQADRVNIVSSKVDEMFKHMELSPTHKQLIQKLRDQPDILDNEIAFVDFYSYYLQQLKLSKDEATADTFLIAETFLSNNISHELFNKKNDLENVLHNVGTDSPSKYQRTSSSSSSHSTESLHEDLDLFNWLSNMF